MEKKGKGKPIERSLEK